MNRSSFFASAVVIVASAGCGATPKQVSATPSPEIETSIKAQAASAAPETAMVGQLFRGTAFEKGGTQDWHVELNKGTCYWFIGQGDGGVERLGLSVWDTTGSKVTDEKSKTNSSVVQHCPKSTGTFKFEAKALRGNGHFAVGVFSKDAPPEPVVEAPKAPDLEKMINDDAAAQAPGATQVGKFLAAQNGKMDWYTSLSAGKCYWFIGAGGDDIDDFYIYLWDPSNTRIGEQKSTGHQATFGHCPKKDGMFKVQVKTDSSSEKFKLGIFEKKK